VFIDFLQQVFQDNVQREAIIWRDEVHPYAYLQDRVDYWARYLNAEQVHPGTVLAIEGDFSPNAIAMMLAAIGQRCILVPLSESVSSKRTEFLEIAQAQVCLSLDQDDEVRLTHLSHPRTHELLNRLAASGHPGLILFSSGSSGKSKAAVHDLVPVLRKFHVKRHVRRAITFLLYDHIGGFNTLLYQLSNAGCVVTVEERSPDAVLRAVEKYQVELLPTSPTFINLILLSEAYRRHDLSSLKLVTYGTEPMPQSTLDRFHELFPHIQLQQTYGLSELGILRSKSRSSNSLWVKVGGEGFDTRVVDGLLEVRAESAMLGYLNALSPFTDDGWFKTGDAVDTDGEWLRILGRSSEMITIGGEKVYPAEVESVLQRMDGVEEVAVTSEANAITGKIVVAQVKLRSGEPLPAFRRRMWSYCEAHLPRYKIPQKVVLLEESLVGERFKKRREPR
jgi:acyl-CoA synthetase (AMP-forming)/AMP-acid ligase II